MAKVLQGLTEKLKGAIEVNNNQILEIFFIAGFHLISYPRALLPIIRQGFERILKISKDCLGYPSKMGLVKSAE